MAVPENSAAAPKNSTTVPEHIAAVPENSTAVPENSDVVSEKSFLPQKRESFQKHKLLIFQITIVHWGIKEFTLERKNNLYFSHELKTTKLESE
ncbi:hypothetical protein TNIN_447191 [Trichonephila inaurata madagascariensis]|uniref:Uncharacterized protein n=1 Tax=Trichonephila inaurata madagascariensis TaxID=2747483 RepID=A0A8X6YVP2_9ARAC|nr:hypothetical protein TNIN_447191 [Trichonephila inaurata madagascariensis]